MFAIALVFFHAAMRLAGARVFVVHQPPLLEDGPTKRYLRLVKSGEWN